MYNHYFDESGIYTMTTKAYPKTKAAPDCIRLESLIDIPDGYWPVLDSKKKGFEFVEDHRGEEGYVNGKRFKITQLGPLPDGWSKEPPVQNSLPKIIESNV